MNTKDDILHELRSLTTVADRFNPQMPYTVPAGYFDHLSEDMLRRIRAEKADSAAEELKILSPLLGKLDRKTPFTIPEGYFNDFTATPSVQLNSANQAKVVRGSFGKRIWKFSAAAAIAGIIALGGWFWFNSPVNKQTGLAAGTTREVMEKIQDMPDSEMKAFLEGGSGTVVYQHTSLLAELKTEDLNLMLADVSDEELQHYAEQSDAGISLN